MERTGTLLAAIACALCVATGVDAQVGAVGGHRDGLAHGARVGCVTRQSTVLPNRADRPREHARPGGRITRIFTPDHTGGRAHRTAECSRVIVVRETRPLRGHAILFPSRAIGVSTLRRAAAIRRY